MRTLDRQRALPIEHAQHNQDQAEPGAVDAAERSERQLPDRVPLSLPRGAEADVDQADRAPATSERRGRRDAPGDEGREARKRKKPVEDLAAARRDIDVGDSCACQALQLGSERTAEREQHQHGEERATRLVDVGEDLRRKACCIRPRLT